MIMQMAIASVSEKRKPQVRTFCFGSNMKCRSDHAFVRIKQDSEVTKGGPEVARSEIATDEHLTHLGHFCAHNVIGE
jgi:hypothetical protein